MDEMEKIIVEFEAVLEREGMKSPGGKKISVEEQDKQGNIIFFYLVEKHMVQDVRFGQISYVLTTGVLTFSYSESVGTKCFGTRFFQWIKPFEDFLKEKVAPAISAVTEKSVTVRISRS